MNAFEYSSREKMRTPNAEACAVINCNDNHMKIRPTQTHMKKKHKCTRTSYIRILELHYRINSSCLQPNNLWSETLAEKRHRQETIGAIRRCAVCNVQDSIAALRASRSSARILCKTKTQNASHTHSIIHALATVMDNTGPWSEKRATTRREQNLCTNRPVIGWSESSDQQKIEKRGWGFLCR